MQVTLLLGFFNSTFAFGWVEAETARVSRAWLRSLRTFRIRQVKRQSKYGSCLQNATYSSRHFLPDCQGIREYRLLGQSCSLRGMALLSSCTSGYSKRSGYSRTFNGHVLPPVSLRLIEGVNQVFPHAQSCRAVGCLWVEIFTADNIVSLSHDVIFDALAIFL